MPEEHGHTWPLRIGRIQLYFPGLLRIPQYFHESNQLPAAGPAGRNFRFALRYLSLKGGRRIPETPPGVFFPVKFHFRVPTGNHGSPVKKDGNRASDRVFRCPDIQIQAVFAHRRRIFRPKIEFLIVEIISFSRTLPGPGRYCHCGKRPVPGVRLSRSFPAKTSDGGFRVGNPEKGTAMIAPEPNHLTVPCSHGLIIFYKN